jgi:hypothetical protein
MLRSMVVACLVAALATSALADEMQYLDDRSTPEAVISSFYSAINLQQYSRAWSYYEDGQGVPPFDDFVKGYETTKSVTVSFGEVAEEGAAGSVYYTLPVSLDAVDTSGKHSYFSGCYTLRLAQPGNQVEPPFHPMHIVEGHLKKAKGSGKSFAPAKCDP